MFRIPDEKKIRVIIDTDAACEADDPFAIVHALMSPKLIVRAIVAEHFAAPGSMRLSYEAIQRLLRAMHREANLLPGEEWPLNPGAPMSEGVRFIIDEALREDTRPLFVLCLGALSNLARALREAPEILHRMTVVTIGGHGYDVSPIPFREFNFGNDIDAANALMSSGAEIWQVPVPAYGGIRTGLAELQYRVAPCGDAGRYLFDQMVAYNESPAAGWTPGESWSLGDSPAVCVTLDPSCGRFHTQAARFVNPDTTYSDRQTGQFVRLYDTVDSRYVLEDFFAKLAMNYLD
jgi:inosine-uridine nucleoside N-ribohydrolase